jgi:NAD(P)-dependent dehydrogenase (short-subunit alcohol dehydrogenase family)
VPDPVFLITGASGGIGAATARAAAAAGYRVVLTGRRAGPLRALAEDLGGPHRALPVCCDVSDWDQLLALVGEVNGTLGRLDVVFANAGGPRRPRSWAGVACPRPSGAGWWTRTCWARR